MDMGRELLRLNLGMYAIRELRHTQITGEMRQAFEALQHIPPMQYIAPREQSDAAERESVTYEQLVEQPVLFSPFLSRGEPRRATREEEAEMVRWARAGITRVRHVLAAGGTRVATLEGPLCTVSLRCIPSSCGMAQWFIPAAISPMRALLSSLGTPSSMAACRPPGLNT